MTMPTNQCPWRMQVHHITQETPDVRTISLICHDYYPCRAGQCVLVSVRNSAGTLRTYTISSTPGVSEYITLTVRRIDDDIGSRWLTRGVKHGDYLWLSDAMGEFTCNDRTEGGFPLLAASCGITPITSMRRWLVKNHPQVDMQVIYNIRTPQDVTSADEWHNYPVTLVAENNVTEGFIAGRFTRELLAGVPDLASRTVMICGPVPYVDWVEQEMRALGVTRFLKGKFFTPVAEAATSDLKFTKLQLAREFYAPVGTMLPEVLESNSIPVVVTYRAGVCGCCRAKMISGEYAMSSTMTLTDTKIAEGYVLACSCHPQGGLVLV